jgi:hypothetical protein
MSCLTTNPASRATSADRAQIVAEAVVSAYIHEIASAERLRKHGSASHNCMKFSPVAIARPRPAARECGRMLAPRRRTALALEA